MEGLKVQAKEWALSENEELLKGVFVVSVFFFLFLGLERGGGIDKREHSQCKIID